MRKKYVEYGLITVFILVISFFGSHFLSTSDEINVDNDELIKNELVINGLDIVGLTIYDANNRSV
ncbi:hypothetical protein [Fredinandcohnia sp. 179-A 10B2 NHS]|uniref:hypothetical protein n=1 Tax=Fredinandcohnia sp. 179-A 10B2 NHS TaxID=3235176 RepID=UPI0039A1D6F6